MALKIAEQIRARRRNHDIVQTISVTCQTYSITENQAFQTIRQIRQVPSAANDDDAFVTREGLPVNFYDGEPNGVQYGDREWIAGKLRRVADKATRRKIAAEYSQRYVAAIEAEPIEHCKAGRARFITNSWLRIVTV